MVKGAEGWIHGFVIKYFFLFALKLVFYNREYLVEAAYHWHLLGMSSSV